MNKIFNTDFVDINISPGRVLFKKNCLNGMVDILSQIGDSAGIVATSSTLDRIRLRTGYISQKTVPFSGEVTEEEIIHITTILDEKSVDFIIGMGGGKAIDCGKSVAFNLRKPFVAIPTSSATCASFTSLAVIYDEKKVFSEYKYLNTPPFVTFVDPELLSKAPIRYAMAGIGDTIAKYVETISSVGREPDDFLSYYSLNIAKDCLKIFENISSSDFNDRKLIDNINFTNIILSGLSSGIGGMSCFATIAHALANGMTKFKNSSKILHGEMIAYTILLEMLIEKFPSEEFKMIYKLCQKCNLPRSSADIEKISGIKIDEEKLKIIYNHSQSDEETANLALNPFTLDQLIEAFYKLENHNIF